MPATGESTGARGRAASGPGAAAAPDVVHRNERTLVRRRTGTGDRASVVVKQALGDVAAARIAHEVAMLRMLAGVPGVPELVDTDGASALVLRDCGRRTLTDVVADGPLDPRRLTALMLQIAEILVRVHAAGVVHRDLNPSNIVVTDDLRPTLVDFDLAGVLGEGRPQFVAADEILGRLPYLAPEQTGRTGLVPDQRCDLYGLGATAYTLATGTAPFGDGDPVALVRDVLVRVPVPLQKVVPGVPRALSEVVARLLEKEPDRRYSSAQGLVLDLRRLVADPDGDFEPGRWDFPGRLAPPTRLVGRERESAVLEAALDTVVRGGFAAVLVSGEPGVGKSALIEQLRPLVTGRGGWLIGGKADQFSQDPGSNVFAQATTTLGTLLLGLPQAELEPLRRRITMALGANAALVTAILPVFAHLLGVPPEVADGDPLENERRLVGSAPILLREVAGPQRPLVIVLDDLQWAGAHAFTVIDTVLTEQVGGVLLVGSYRSTEVDPAHPLTAMLQRWERLHVAPQRVELPALPDTDVAALLGAMLRVDPGPAARLAGLLAETAHGNPFDTVVGVNALRDAGLLRLSDAGWEWDGTAVRAHLHDGDVLEMLRARIGGLRPETRDALQVMACLGGQVQVDLLAAACGTDADTIADRLRPAVDDGLLVVELPPGLTDGAHAAGLPAVLDGAAVVLFRHDRVQQVAHDLLGDEERTRLRLDLARRMTARGRDAEAAGHYLAALELVTDPQECRAVVTLLRGAAQRARLISNHAGVERYVRAARTVQQAIGGEGDRDPVLAELDVELHAALYALGRPDEADEVFERIHGRTRDPLDLVAAAALQIAGLTNRGLIPEAMALGLGLLADLGLPSPGEEVMAEVRAGYDRVSRWLRETRTEDDVGRPVATDATAVGAARIMVRLCPPAFFTDHPLLGWLVTQAQSLWAEHGPQGYLIPCLGHTNAFELGCAPDRDLDRDLVMRAIAAGEAHHVDEALVSHAHFLHAVLHGHWHQPLEAVAAEAQHAREGLLRGGDLQTATFASYPSVIALTDCAPTLDELAPEVDGALALCARTGNDQAGENFVAFRQFVRALRGRTSAPGSFADDAFAPERHVAACTPANPMALVYFHLLSACSAAIFGQWPRLTRHLAELDQVVVVVGGTYGTAMMRILHGIDRAERIRAAIDGGGEDGVGGGDVGRLLAELDAHHTFLHEAAVGAPDNFAHLDLWLRAERAWALDDQVAAMEAFDAALATADEVRRPWHEALLAERAGLFHQRGGREHHAALLLTVARQRYQEWGAIGKVRQLDQAHPRVRTRALASARSGAVREASSNSTGLTDDAIDTLAILRASQALALHQDLDALREAVTVQLQALTGATGVRLALMDNGTGQWKLPPEQGSPTWQASADEVAKRLPLTAVRYAERTREPLLVPDAVTDSRFAADPYFRGLHHCALMVLPLGGQGSVQAMLVLENRLSRGVFTANRLDAVRLLAGQLAVSLDNALAQRFRALVQRASEATIVVGRDGVVTYASPPSATLLGVNDTDLLGRRARDLFHPDDRDELDVRLADLLAVVEDPDASSGPVDAGDAAAGWQARVARADGDVRWVDVRITDLRSDPAVAGIVVRLHDVTARRRLETQLRHAQKMESVGQLAAGVAHEINTPIQFIGDNLRFIDRTVGDLARLIRAWREPQLSDPAQLAAEIDVDYLLEELPDALHQTLAGVDRVAEIVRAMKASVHPGQETMSATDLNETVRNTLVIANSQVKYVADVDLDLDPELPPVLCHPGDISQVVLNLIINAAHAVGETLTGSRPRGTIRVRTRGRQQTAVIEVEDDGIGIPAGVADRVFEQFFTTKPVGAGTGQGLSLAYYLIHDRHHGSIDFSSRPGRGTTFTVTIPFDQRHSQPDAADVLTRLPGPRRS